MGDKLKILHSADWHLDTPFRGVSGSQAALRRGEQRDMIDKIAYLANNEEVDVVLLAGDLFDSPKTAMPESINQLERFFSSVHCPIIISPGNHDYYTPDGIYAKIKRPDNVYIFENNRLQYFDFPEREMRVFGAAFVSDSSAPLLNNKYSEVVTGSFEAALIMNENYFGLMCIHGDYNNPNSKYNPISPKDVEKSGLDYFALGHIHKSSGLIKCKDTFLYNPGCPEGRGFDETGEKTVAIVELDRKQDTCKVRKHDVSKRKYQILNADVTGTDPLIKIRNILPEETGNDIYRIILTGEGTPDVGRLYRNLKDSFFSLEIMDKTVTPLDIWNHVGEDTLKGVFLRKMIGLLDNAANEEERESIIQSIRWGIAALDNCEEVYSCDNQ